MATPVEDWIVSGSLAKAAGMMGWVITAFGDRPGLFRVDLVARDLALYHVKLDWSECPAPPSVRFCDASLEIQVRSAWPAGTSLFHDYVKPPPDCFLCCPLTKEGMAHHPEWLSAPEAMRWKNGELRAEQTIAWLNGLLQSQNYTGRCT